MVQLRSLILSPLCNADVIFLIYLYQRWIYPVDRKRVNEYGFGGEDENASNANSIDPNEAVSSSEKKTN